ncbi:hypothetical protein QYE76_006971 [Lolium multiflorum]|uniref:Protein kinase domain-containing protein n=1 Tax=Lolium multiflorum TaxID=4521 RepID=A0AAD8W4V8_LOLMU|nr:hypothetical protein QYE76_006971 [Lolium multiflorum]
MRSSLSMSMAVVAALLLSMSTAATGRVPVALAPDCNTTCGKVKVPYPFGMGPRHCYRQPGFKLICDYASKPPRPYLDIDGGREFEVTDIFVENNTMRVVSSHGLNMSGTGRSRWSLGGRSAGADGTGATPLPYVLLAGFNELIITGCNVLATLVGNGHIVSGCASFCSSTDDHGSGVTGSFNPDGNICSNIGCCQSEIPIDYASYDVRLRRLDLDDDGTFPKKKNSTTAGSQLPVNVIIAATDWLTQDMAMFLNDPEFSPRPKTGLGRVPVILRWAVPHESAVSDFGTRECPRSAARSICKSINSQCRDEASATFRGYSCKCKEGYQGNAYLTDGCQDIDECKHKEEYGCFGECGNKIGSFDCWCPPGYHGNATRHHGCIKSVIKNKNTGLSVTIGVSCGAGLVLSVLTAFFVYKKLKSRRAKMLRRKFFEQNHGQLLEQLVSQKAGIAERMIITLDELKKATRNFDEDLVVGGGGHGTVYMGILSNQHIVAIKKPKKLVQKEIDEFINEVAILSQINHRNVVKLYGCCLETEVPMLIYEFISNGTLSEHLHVEGPKSLSWSDRLRIAIETSKSIAYLHSTTSIPIIHRDIKSANILLDDSLIAKVADFGASRCIPIEKSGITTKVQGTRGYWDPACFYTGRLTEKSDVFSFGVVLVELLTRKKPFEYLSSDDEALIVRFARLFAEGNLLEILDPQIVEEGGHEVEEVANIAVACIKLTPESRPTMRQVELTLEGIRVIQEGTLDNVVSNNVYTTDIGIYDLSAIDRRGSEGSTRCYSMEEEFALSARYSR